MQYFRLNFVHACLFVQMPPPPIVYVDAHGGDSVHRKYAYTGRQHLQKLQLSTGGAHSVGCVHTPEDYTYTLQGFYSGIQSARSIPTPDTFKAWRSSFGALLIYTILKYLQSLSNPFLVLLICQMGECPNITGLHFKLLSTEDALDWLVWDVPQLTLMHRLDDPLPLGAPSNSFCFSQKICCDICLNCLV